LTELISSIECCVDKHELDLLETASLSPPIFLHSLSEVLSWIAICFKPGAKHPCHAGTVRQEDKVKQRFGV